MRLPSPLAAAALIGLAACATVQGPEAASRFDRYEGAQMDLRGYERVFLAPVVPSEALRARIGYRPISPTDRVRPLSEKILDEQTADLHDEMAQRIGRVATLVDAPGPGVLTIATELTALDANRPTMADLWARPGLDFRSISVGDAGVNVTFSEEGRELATLQDRAVRRTFMDPTLGIRIWGTADRYYERLGDKVADLLA